MARSLKLSPRMKAQREYVQNKLADSIICQRCGATKDTFADRCAAGLSESCDGFETIEAAREEYDHLNPMLKRDNSND